MTAALQLPADLVAFLKAGRELEYDPDEAEPGKLIFKALADLKLGEIFYASQEEGHEPGVNEEPGGGEDPHIDDEEGYYLVPAVNLVASCTGDYPPKALLAWIPDVEMYATWDGGHFEILVFPSTTWAAIASSPLKYVNAQWSDDPPGYYLAPWLHGYDYRYGWPEDSYAD